MNFNRYRAGFTVLLPLAIFVFSACGSGSTATPTPLAELPGQPTPTPVISTEDGVTSVIVHLSPVQGEGQLGTATLSSDGTTTTVEIEVGPVATEAQPIHVHIGKCEDVGTVLHALQNVVNGKSTTTINSSLDEILSNDALVNVHASYTDASTYTACGQLPAELP